MKWPNTIRLAAAHELDEGWLAFDTARLDAWLRNLEPVLGSMPRSEPVLDDEELSNFIEHLQSIEAEASETVVRPILELMREVFPAYSETLRSFLRWRVGTLRKQLKKIGRLDPGCGPTSVVLVPIWELSRVRRLLCGSSLAVAWVVELETDS